ncbi:efflux transporter outer membrane subunit [Desulfocurvus sp. DL9XJH121]
MSTPLHITIALLAALLAAGCAPFAPSPRDPAPQGMPVQYGLYEDWDKDAQGPTPDRWWTELGGQELDALMRQALTGDFSVRQAWATLRQARAQARQAGAGLTPSLSGKGGATHTRSWSEANGKETFSLGEDYELGLSASYEMDLWGRVRATAEAGNLDAASSRQDLETAAATVAGNVAEAWIDLLATREENRLVREQIRVNQDILRVQELLLAASGATALDVLQQRENLASVKALLPDLSTRERTLSSQLAILTGHAPGTVAAPGGDALPELPPTPPAGLPADLLAKRPDVRGAGLSLRAADWEVAAARADRLPAITITGSGAYSGTGLETLFDAWALKLAGSLVMPILDGGQRSAEVDRVRAVAEQRLAAYEETVFTAIKEVDDAMATERGQLESIAALETQLGAARDAEAEARRRYLGGVDASFLPYLQAVSTVQGLQRTLVQERTDLLKNRVALYIALGGGWTGDLTPDGLADPDTNSGTRKTS